MNKKISSFRAIFIVIILATIAAWGLVKYSFYQVSNDLPINTSTSVATAPSWKTYVNSKYGFEIKYPPNFDEQTSSSDEFGLSAGYPSDSRMILINIFPQNNKDQISFDKEINKINSEIEKNNNLTYSGGISGAIKIYKNFYISGKKAITYESIDYPVMGSNIITDIEIDSSTFLQIEVFGSKDYIDMENMRVNDVPENTELKNIMDQMVSTFKFTNPDKKTVQSDSQLVAQEKAKARSLSKKDVLYKDRRVWRNILNWPQECEDAFNFTSLDLTGNTNWGNIDFYPLSLDTYIVEVNCTFGWYQGYSYHFLLNEQNDSSLPVSKLLTLKTYDKNAKQQIDLVDPETKLPQVWGLSDFDSKNKILSILNKWRGIGDCGEYTTYAFQNENLVLKEYRMRNCEDPNTETDTDPANWPLYYSAPTQ